jgi:hypothetical protein
MTVGYIGHELLLEIILKILSYEWIVYIVLSSAVLMQGMM